MPATTTAAQVIATTSPEVMLSVVISVTGFLLFLVGWFLVRTLTQIEKSISEGKVETAGLREELSQVKGDLKDYAGLVRQQSEELSSLKRAYAALERAFRALDRWLYGQHLGGHLPQPPEFHDEAHD